MATYLHNIVNIEQAPKPLKDQINSLDRVSLLFLLIGFPLIIAFAIITAYLLPIIVPIIVVILFLIILGLIFFRNYL